MKISGDMIGNDGNRMGIPRGLRSFFWVCYFHEVGLSRKKPGYSKVNIRIKKDLMQHGKCVLHKVLNSYFFLGSQRMPNFALLTGLDDAEISQKHIVTLYGHYINIHQLQQLKISSKLFDKLELARYSTVTFCPSLYYVPE